MHVQSKASHGIEEEAFTCAGLKSQWWHLLPTSRPSESVSIP